MRNYDAYILTYTGQKVHPLGMRPESICIEDIAHALANKCRFTCHTRTFFSVAQHSVIVSGLLIENPLWGLLHDAAEAYLPDVASTVKDFFPTLKYAEEMCMEVIAQKFGLPELDEKQKRDLKRIDRAVLRAEYKALINDPQGYDLGVDMTDIPDLHWQPSEFWHPVEAERVFLRVFNDESAKEREKETR